VVSFKPSYNACVIAYGVESGVVVTIVVPGLTTNPSFDSTKQIKIPGGGAESGETPWQAARREFHEETGLKIKPKAPHALIYHEKRDMHEKMAYLVPLSYCHGMLRRKPRREKDSVLYMPLKVSIDDAIDMVHQTPRNQFHPNALRAAREEVLRLLKMEESQNLSPVAV
jgi:8-oxo-dGTP pyrophosphatase MutT (NUDIX family)